MKNDEYGTLLEETLRSADHPLTAAELREQVGCSRQRVYTWLQANAAKVRVTGKDKAGGARYEWCGHGAVGQLTPMDDSFHIQSFFVDHGNVVFVLSGPDGSTYHARPAH